MKPVILAFFTISVMRVFSQQSLLIQHASLADGTGKPLYQADVRIVGDRIAEIGSLHPGAAEKVLDAHGLILAPGFIDMHNHSTDPSSDLMESRRFRKESQRFSSGKTAVRPFRLPSISGRANSNRLHSICKP